MYKTIALPYRSFQLGIEQFYTSLHASRSAPPQYPFKGEIAPVAGQIQDSHWAMFY